MEYRKFGKVIVARLDKGEEILAQLKEICLKEDVKLATVTAIGATNDFTVGALDTQTKQYISSDFHGDFEIVSLSGTVNTFNDEFYTHLHMSAGNEQGSVCGGHLNRAIISATCEMVITLINGRVDRRPDKETGLNIFRF